MAEYGTHDELIALGGLYKSMFDKQQLEKQLREEHPVDLSKGGEKHV